MDLGWVIHPICTAIKCPSPPVAAYSRLDPLLAEDPVVNQTITYTCSSSEYTLLGSNLNRCLQDGTWENDPPVCQRKCDPADTRRYTNLTCFRTSDTRRTWEASFNFCYDDKGELLVTVKDVDMQNFIAQLTGENLDNNVWIGAREGLDWKWRQNDTYIDRFFWEIAYPDSSSGDCIEISYQSNSGEFAWSPRSPGDEIGVLCQYNRTCHSVGLSQSNMVLEYMGTCFQFLDVSKNCDDGAEECNGRGGFLAEILDESTNALLLDRALHLRDIGVNTAWWIGGYDEDVGRSWYWSDKTRMNYEGWYEGEPNTNSETA
ncbi:C-type mannose receptor 2 [Strongylocentrotus purpuratus]|uniref:Uncharacterized protein n=1 Tax=Strongylocentrotus purpuratus TaxID=7668 RepID=A0A7M7SUY4_STRPU|nr:C-type mannose receptor 2 [Strongylocentrotus purpuratus]